MKDDEYFYQLMNTPPAWTLDPKQYTDCVVWDADTKELRKGKARKDTQEWHPSVEVHYNGHGSLFYFLLPNNVFKDTEEGREACRQYHQALEIIEVASDRHRIQPITRQSQSMNTNELKSYSSAMLFLAFTLDASSCFKIHSFIWP
jgi:hypothetical protein